MILKLMKTVQYFNKTIILCILRNIFGVFSFSFFYPNPVKIGLLGLENAHFLAVIGHLGPKQTRMCVPGY